MRCLHSSQLWRTRSNHVSNEYSVQAERYAGNGQSKSSIRTSLAPQLLCKPMWFPAKLQRPPIKEEKVLRPEVLPIEEIEETTRLLQKKQRKTRPCGCKRRHPLFSSATSGRELRASSATNGEDLPAETPTQPPMPALRRPTRRKSRLQPWSLVV